jgi:hypothetical protein
MGVCQSVRCAWIDFQSCILHQLCGGDRSSTNRHDLVIIAMQNQGWHIELFEVFSEVRFGECLDAVEGVLVSRLHSLEPEPIVGGASPLENRAL